MQYLCQLAPKPAAHKVAKISSPAGRFVLAAAARNQ
jgi:hypothetical protein